MQNDAHGKERVRGSWAGKSTVELEFGVDDRQKEMTSRSGGVVVVAVGGWW